jgi:hypothetical protein
MNWDAGWQHEPPAQPEQPEQPKRAAHRRPARRRPRLRTWALAAAALVVVVAAVVVVTTHKQAATSPISAGNSRANCVDVAFTNGVLQQSDIDSVGKATGTTYDCLTVFNSAMPEWSNWEDPWMFKITSDGWGAWLRADPGHQVVLGTDLIPKSVANSQNPLTWEEACAAGDYNQQAATLARNLVSYGAGSIVIRLGVEANGSWETDYVGTTGAEMSAWAKCYDSEVTAMRAVPGAHFLFVWNPNSCTANLPIDKWYPGNAYVDIIGIDVYDKDCKTSKTVAQEGWQAYSTDSASQGSGAASFPSLVNVAAFAKSNGKPLSFPEWGLTPGADDAAYVQQLGKVFNSGDFAFESYFDTGNSNVAQLGSGIPNATAAYAEAFK